MYFLHFICSYIEFLSNIVSNKEFLEEKLSSQPSSASSSPIQATQYNFNTGAPILSNEKLSYLFNVWRMEVDYNVEKAE